MRQGDSSKDSTKLTRTSNETTALESSRRPHGTIRRFLGEVKGSVKDGVKNFRTSRLKDSGSCSPVSRERAPSTTNIEARADIPSELRDVQKAASRMHPLSGPAITVASVGQDAQVDLDAVDGFQGTYLMPLGTFDTIIGEIAKDHLEFKHGSSTAMDLQKFMQVFGGIILHSTSHLYVSALPSSPPNSPILRLARLPNTFRVTCGSDMKNWPAVQTVLKEHTDWANLVSFSPDGTRIVTGSEDKTVQLWDAGTGQPVGEPLRGHTSPVTSFSFSLDGTRIVTGSLDNTVWLRDAPTKQPSRQCALSDPPAFSEQHHIMHHPITIITPITWNNRFIGSSSNSINPATASVIPRGCLELDLNRMTHGRHWQQC